MYREGDVNDKIVKLILSWVIKGLFCLLNVMNFVLSISVLRLNFSFWKILLVVIWRRKK